MGKFLAHTDCPAHEFDDHDKRILLTIIPNRTNCPLQYLKKFSGSRVRLDLAVRTKIENCGLVALVRRKGFLDFVISNVESSYRDQQHDMLLIPVRKTVQFNLERAPSSHTNVTYSLLNSPSSMSE